MLEKTFCMLAHEEEFSNYMTTQKLYDEKDNQSDILCLWNFKFGVSVLNVI